MSNEMTGVVEAVGDKFNGSLKVNGSWVSNKKGFKNPAKVGDKVKLTLEPWEFKDKKGENITAVELLGSAPSKAPSEFKPASKAFTKASTEYVGRDFDAENRGKVRHGLTVALVPLLAQETISVDKAKEVVNSLVEFVMTGK